MAKDTSYPTAPLSRYLAPTWSKDGDCFSIGSCDYTHIRGASWFKTAKGQVVAVEVRDEEGCQGVITLVEHKGEITISFQRLDDVERPNE